MNFFLHFLVIKTLDLDSGSRSALTKNAEYTFGIHGIFLDSYRIA
jgi:hypothetical protein